MVTSATLTVNGRRVPNFLAEVADLFASVARVLHSPEVQEAFQTLTTALDAAIERERLQLSAVKGDAE